MLAVAAALGMHHRRQNGGGGVGTGQHIHKRHTDLHRHTIGLAGHAHQTAHTLNHEIISGAVRVWPMHAKPGNRTIDKPRIDGLEGRIIKTVFGQPAHLEIFYQNVGFCCQLAQDSAAFRGCDVDRKRSFVAVDGTEIGRACRGIGFVVASDIINKGWSPSARIIAAAGAFDLDNIGTQIPQHLRGPRASQNA